MRAIIPELGYIPRGRSTRNILVLVGYVVFLAVVIIVYARVFQYLMTKYEGQPDHSFLNGLYWTITTMTTLGYGDITFTTHAGMMFSAWVTLSGFLFLLVLLPFGIISVVFAPWLENILRFRPRMRLKRGAKGHVIICGWDTVTASLAKALAAAGRPYVGLIPDLEEVRRLEESGALVVHGVPTDAEALKRVRVDTARMVIGNLSDPDNANLTLTAKSICPTPVVAIITEPEREELLRVAGADHVVPLRETLGNYLAVRVAARGTMGHVVDSLGDLLFAEFPSHGTPFVGLALRDAGIREKSGASVIGMWQRGSFSFPQADTVIKEGMVLLVVGTENALEALGELVRRDARDETIVILGHGTVGSASASLLRRMNVPHVVIDRDAVPDPEEPGMIQGDAREQSVLERAGIRTAGGLIVTTNDDGVNVFLTLAARHLNPRIRIAARASLESNVAELYAAGADFVVSHSSVGASILTNLIEGRRNVFLAEGVHIFWRQVPAALDGKTLAASGIRSLTGATAVAVQSGRDKIDLGLAPTTILDRHTALILVGTPESEALFAKRFGKHEKGVTLEAER